MLLYWDKSIGRWQKELLQSLSTAKKSVVSSLSHVSASPRFCQLCISTVRSIYPIPPFRPAHIPPTHSAAAIPLRLQPLDSDWVPVFRPALGASSCRRSRSPFPNVAVGGRVLELRGGEPPPPGGRWEGRRDAVEPLAASAQAGGRRSAALPPPPETKGAARRATAGGQTSGLPSRGWRRAAAQRLEGTAWRRASGASAGCPARGGRVRRVRQSPSCPAAATTAGGTGGFFSYPLGAHPTV